MRLEYFQMVDRISLLDPEARLVRAESTVPDESPVFEGHFPGHPLLPGVLMIETMAQTGGWLVLATLRFARMPFLAQVKEAKFRGFVTPGQKLEVEARLVQDGSGYAVVTGRIDQAGRKVAEAEIRYGVAAFPNETLRAQMLDMARRVAVPEAYLPGDSLEGSIVAADRGASTTGGGLPG
jgi:3-hydroxyacyl-[acyl-carrier-protein] dehydratase